MDVFLRKCSCGNVSSFGPLKQLKGRLSFPVQSIYSNCCWEIRWVLIRCICPLLPLCLLRQRFPLPCMKTDRTQTFCYTETPRGVVIVAWILTSTQTHPNSPKPTHTQGSAIHTLYKSWVSEMQVINRRGDFSQTTVGVVRVSPVVFTVQHILGEQHGKRTEIFIAWH